MRKLSAIRTNETQAWIGNSKSEASGKSISDLAHDKSTVIQNFICAATVDMHMGLPDYRIHRAERRAEAGGAAPSLRGRIGGTQKAP